MTFQDPLGRTFFTRKLADDVTAIEVAPGQYVCDFCMSPGPTWEYPCGPVQLVGNPNLTDSDDEWAACERCHDLIEAGLVLVLVKHMVQAQMSQPLMPGWVVPKPKELHRDLLTNVLRFMKARTGPARPFTERSSQ